MVISYRLVGTGLQCSDKTEVIRGLTGVRVHTHHASTTERTPYDLEGKKSVWKVNEYMAGYRQARTRSLGRDIRTNKHRTHKGMLSCMIQNTNESIIIWKKTGIPTTCPVERQSAGIIVHET